MSEANDIWNTPESEQEKPEKEKVLHPAGGPYIIRAADLFRAEDGKDKKTGAPYPQFLLICLSECPDNGGKPLWIFTKGSCRMGASQKGKPRLRAIAEAFLGHVMGEEEARATSPASLADLVKGRYAQGMVSHWGGGRGAQIDTFMPLRGGVAHQEIDLSGYNAKQEEIRAKIAGRAGGGE